MVNKVYFGGEKPPPYRFTPLKNGKNGVWVHRNIVEDEDGWSADAVYFETVLPEDEALREADRLFEPVEPMTTVDDLVEAINILTGLVLGGG